MMNKNLGKNELLGVGNLLFGIGYLSLQLWFIFRGIPDLQEVFTNFGAQAPSEAIFYIVAAIYIAISFANLFIGIKLFQNNKSETYFSQGLLIFGVSIAAMIAFPIIYNLLVVFPIFNLTKSL